MLRNMADTAIFTALQSIRANIQKAAASRVQGSGDVKLVAVSKTKPVEAILDAYDAGQRYFGENYVQELVQKASDSQITERCPDIKWHFIGHLQSGKVNKLLTVPNLFVVETIDSTKLADLLNKAYRKRSTDNRLDVMLEVNTSREPNKHGFLPEQVKDAALFVREKCPALNLKGLMTIGSVLHSTEIRPNPDFQQLYTCHQSLCRELQLDPAELELSMGMSEDYEHAIEMGSTEVRVGSKIFGARVYKEFVADKKSGDEE